jgi:hypothetical protein
MLGADYRERARGYASLFPQGAPIRGDCSPRYALFPWRPKVSEHIADLVPDARLIYLVRDPVERTIANYAQTVTHGVQKQPLDQAVEPENPDNYYVAGSRYATQVEVYLRCFDQGQLLVIDQADLRDARAEVMRLAFTHVGADPDFWDREFSIEHNVRGADNVRLGGLGKRLRDSGLNRLSRRVLPSGARRGLVSVAKRALGGDAVQPEVSPEFRERLAEALAPEAERLRRLTGQRFASWSV